MRGKIHGSVLLVSGLLHFQEVGLTSRVPQKMSYLDTQGSLGKREPGPPQHRCDPLSFGDIQYSGGTKHEMTSARLGPSHLLALLLLSQRLGVEGWEYGLAVECLSSMCGALGSIPSTT